MKFLVIALLDTEAENHGDGFLDDDDNYGKMIKIIDYYNCSEVSCDMNAAVDASATSSATATSSTSSTSTNPAVTKQNNGMNSNRLVLLGHDNYY